MPDGSSVLQGLTALGDVAIHQMMSLRMMIDVDHGGQKTLQDIMAHTRVQGAGDYPPRQRPQRDSRRRRAERSAAGFRRRRTRGHGHQQIGYVQHSQRHVVHRRMRVDDDVGKLPPQELQDLADLVGLDLVGQLRPLRRRQHPQSGLVGHQDFLNHIGLELIDPGGPIIPDQAGIMGNHFSL
jgi:hypothetical protein